MRKSGFRTISIPISYYDKIEAHIKRSNGFYVSVSEVVREALREYFKHNGQPD